MQYASRNDYQTPPAGPRTIAPCPLTTSSPRTSDRRARGRRHRRSALADALATVGDRWTLLLIAALLDGPRRFGELQAEVEGIAPNVLTQRLRQLERNALVVARPYSERPPRFVYELTAAGRELAGVLRLLAGWGARNAEGAAAPAARGVRDADGGALVVPDVRAAGVRRRGRGPPLRLRSPVELIRCLTRSGENAAR